MGGKLFGMGWIWANVLLGNGLAVGMGYNRRSPAGAGLLGEGDGLWKEGTVWIIWIRGKLSKHVGGRIVQQAPQKRDFTPPLPMCELDLAG